MYLGTNKFQTVTFPKKQRAEGECLAQQTRKAKQIEARYL